MRKIYILLFIVSTLQVKSQVKITDTLYNKQELKIENLNNQVDSLNKKFKSFKTTYIKIVRNNDSLINTVNFYKSKEDYYAVAIGEQATRFALIISGLLALLAFVSYSVFKFEIRRIKKKTDKKLEKQSEKFELFKDKVNLLDKELKFSQANIYASIGIYYSEKKQFAQALQYHLLSSKYHGIYKTLELKSEELIQEEIEKNYELVLNHLLIAEDCLNNIKNSKEKLELKENLKTIYSLLDDISIYKYDKVKLKTSKLRIDITASAN